jgi:hypothetical protein
LIAPIWFETALDFGRVTLVTDLGTSMVELEMGFDQCFLKVNGERIAETSDRRNARNSYTFSIEELTANALIYGCGFGELPSSIERIFLSSFRAELIDFNPSFGRAEDGDYYLITVDSFIELATWNRPYTPASFIKEFKSIISDQFGNRIAMSNLYDDASPGARLVFAVNNAETKIGDSINETVDLLKAIEAQAITNCLEQIEDKSLATYFSFPEEVKSACEQYLLYFREFLRDVGINASVEIKEEADRVLFSVTPRDSHEALDRIRQILDLYIGLPTATFTTTDEKGYRLEAQRLSANIMHYQSQLVLAQAMIEQKDATIGLLKDRLILQGQMVEGRLLPEPAERKEDDKEEILGGAVEIKKYEGKGFVVNLPKLYRDLRDWIIRDKDK